VSAVEESAREAAELKVTAEDMRKSTSKRIAELQEMEDEHKAAVRCVYTAVLLF